MNTGEQPVITSAISDNCTDVGKRIGAIMTDPDLDGILPQESEATLMLAARVENWENVIRPALEEGKIIISDRFQTCFAIYQDLDFPVAKRRLWEFGLSREADLEFIYDIDPGRTPFPARHRRQPVGAEDESGLARDALAILGRGERRGLGGSRRCESVNR